jgi:hypothetical protein
MDTANSNPFAKSGWPMVTVALLAEVSFVIAVDRPWFEAR